MDPLSIVAGAIALAQAAAGMAKAAQLLRGFSKARVEFCDLLNEIATLQGIINDIENALIDMSRKDDKYISPPINLESTSMRLVLQDLNQTTSELEALAERLVEGSKGRDGARLHRISRLQWQREKLDVVRLREKVRHTRESLTLCFGALHASQSAHHVSATLDIKSIAEDMADQLRHDIPTHIRRTGKDLENRFSAAVRQENELLLASISQLFQNKQALSQEGLKEQGRKPSGPGPAICVQAELRQRCELTCKCQCHKKTSIKTPTWLQPVVGAFLVNYNSLPVLGPRPCNSSFCRAGSGTSITVQYYFPTWLFSLGIHLSSSWSGLASQGARFHLQAPLVIGAGHPVWSLFDFDVVDELRGMLTNRTVLPNCVSSYGLSLLLRALQMQSWKCVKLLMDVNSNPLLEAENSGSSVTYATMLLHSNGNSDTPPDQDQLQILKTISESGDVLGSTILHDTILGLNDVSLEFALSTDPSSLNVLDKAGMALIHWAIDRVDEAALDFLISHGADLELASPSVQTPLIWLCKRVRMNPANSDSSARMAASLLRAGCDPNRPAPRSGVPPLHWAVNSKSLVKLLLEAGADATSKCRMGFNVLVALSVQVVENSYQRRFPMLISDIRDTVSSLVAAGADPNTHLVYCGNETPLLLAAESYHPEANALVQYLHQAGGRLDAVDSDGKSILHRAGCYGTVELLEYLRGATLLGLDPDARDGEGHTPLDYCYARVPEVKWDAIIPKARGRTAVEELAFGSLVVETRERKWDEGLFLYSREDHDMWEQHCDEKGMLEKRWREMFGEGFKTSWVVDWEVGEKAEAVRIAKPRWLERKCQALAAELPDYESVTNGVDGLRVGLPKDGGNTQVEDEFFDALEVCV
ncbi:ankyrin repeat-containing domain protein [Podospora aff. communis PSN243]|uniref:Ankyrin repeat-containing domain protein n=1 Tax=Podospora aff. communis PSN243 TaxID=3040156 RepID=A0AAV9GV87_9PEZI|nr:ankyrin repeat-containing domain protein [Podospora aff. communis PSN243]